jgi:ribose transport system permease protein
MSTETTEPPPPLRRQSIGSRAAGRRFSGRTIGLVISAVVLMAALAIQSPSFLKVYTMSVIEKQVAFRVLIALAQAVCLVVGGMNLSVGAISSIVTVLLGICFERWSMPGIVAVPIALAGGCLAGWINGSLVTRLKIDSFIVTLSMMFVFQGLRSGISGGLSYHLPESFTWLGRGDWLNGAVPLVFVVSLGVLLLFSGMFRHTVFGRRLLATGGNLEAARLSGIDTDSMILRANVISGLLAAAAAVLWASRQGSASPETGDGWLIESFAVAIIGGTGLNGGIVSGVGIFMGAVIFTLIEFSLAEMTSLNQNYANSILGGLILLSIIVDRLRETYGDRRASGGG